MGIIERREREKNERRRAILNGARELILSKGVERVSMEEIAKKAELSKATVYLYFSGKEVIFNEICEESARIFLEHIKPFLETGVMGMAALRCFWRGYVELFGNSDEMIIVFMLRNFLNPGQPLASMEDQGKRGFVNIILETMKNIIDQCKAEGVFDPNLDSQMATHLLLTIFSNSVDSAANIPMEIRKSPALIEEMTRAFQIIVNGFAKEGVSRNALDILG
ncbi:MAG: TetR/AcrR family transcriptional regulator [Treponema sp.]|jgi:AcrR family transcriptional regulator|nr:TetR/AcrR family transcriptional regulator [Treponema sp.]